MLESVNLIIARVSKYLVVRPSGLTRIRIIIETINIMGSIRRNDTTFRRGYNI